MPTNKLQSHLISIWVNRSVSFSDKALKKSLPRKLNQTLHADQAMSMLHECQLVSSRLAGTYLTPVVPSVSRTTPASFHRAFVASSDLVQYGSVNCKQESK